MAIRYYPSFAVKINLISRGNFSLDGKPYTGYYYETFDGKYFSGNNPVTGTNKRLFPVTTSEVMGDMNPVKNKIKYSKGNEFLLRGQPYSGPYQYNRETGNYVIPQSLSGESEEVVLTPTGAPINDSAGKDPLLILGSRKNYQLAKEPTPYYPIPLEEDYQKGYILRYFIKKINERGYVVEISPEEFSAFSNGSVKYDVSLYQAEKVFWKITGSEKTVRLSQYDIREGVEDTNKRLIEKLQLTFVGIKEFINGEYKKFYRPIT